MELNCEIPNSQLHIFNRLYYRKYQNNTCSSKMLQSEGCTAINAKTKPYRVLSIIMKANNHYLELFKSKNFPNSYGRAENAIKIFFGWSVGVNIKELSEYLDVGEDIAKHFYLLSTLYAKKYITNHLDEWMIGGPGTVVLIDLYPGGCKKFNYITRNEHNSVLCLAEVKDVPTKYWFQILNQTQQDKTNREILEAVKSMIRPGSMLVVDLESTGISEETYAKMKQVYQIVVNLESLKRHDTENESLLQNLETIWKPALNICEFAGYHSDISSYYTSYLWNQRFGNNNLNALLSLF